MAGGSRWLPLALVWVLVAVIGCDAALWDRELRRVLKKLPVVMLRQEDFYPGTYRIRSSGHYKLMEDIEFAPRPEDDYWPPLDDPNYPMGNYFLGFFAAITVEAPNVWIDLNGFSIVQSKEHYLLQRFFNTIELADRIFKSDQGVNSLNYQPTDNLHFGSGKVGAEKSANGLLISGGTLGFSSHNGIHGNDPKKVIIEDMIVKDFEVAGIQVNGGKRVLIQRVNVGPSSTMVPAGGHFAAAWIMKRFVEVYIPYELQKQGITELLQEKISFADRPSTRYSLEMVFKRFSRAVTLFRRHQLGTLPDEDTLEASDQDLLGQALRVWGNRFKLPDGSALYGLLIHRAGTAVDGFANRLTNFYNNEGSRLIVIKKVKVHDLKMRVRTIPTISNSFGEVMQGLARDVVKIEDISSYNLTTVLEAEYVGDIHHDAIFALWKLSSMFYNEVVYDSVCGNFGSNTTVNYDVCAGTPQSDSMTGRDTSMLQKRTFGGLKISQELFDWATIPASRLSEILGRYPNHITSRQKRHYVTCGMDSMFHVNKGIVGMRIEFSKGVYVTSSSVNGLTNSAEKEPWHCTDRWFLKDEYLASASTFQGGSGAADIRGIFFGLSSKVHLKGVKLGNFNSEEGMVLGIDVKADTNDLSDYPPTDGVKYEGVRIEGIHAGRGDNSIPYRSNEAKTNIGGIKVKDVTPLHNNFGRKKASLIYQLKGLAPASLPGDPNTPPVMFFEDGEAIPGFKEYIGLETEERVQGLRDRCARYYQEYFGLYPDVIGKSADTIYEGDGWYFTPFNLGFEGTFTNNPDDPMSILEIPYRTTTICTDEKGCTKPTSDSVVHDYSFAIVFTAPEVKLHGTFGGIDGKLAYGDRPGSGVLCGAYSFENTGLLPNNENLVVNYYSLCPIEFTKHVVPYEETVWSFLINCRTESNLFGVGQTFGIYFFKWDKEVKRYRVDSNAMMIFDDELVNPYIEPVKTDLRTDAEFPIYEQQINFRQDGIIKQVAPFPGVEQLSISKGYHHVNGAGVRFLQRFTSYKTKEDMIAMRREFLVFLRDVFGVGLVATDATVYDEIPLHLRVELGQGNVVQDYAVSHDANLRVMQHLTRGIEDTYLSDGDRVHEGGFRLIVGTAGIMSPTAGFIPPRSIIERGVYLVENIRGSGVPMQVDFWTDAAMYTNRLEMAPAMHRTYSEEYGEGISIFIHGTIFNHHTGVYDYHMSGSLIWGSVIVDPANHQWTPWSIDMQR